MNFVKTLIGLPLLLILLVFAFVNNDLVTFNLWPFYLEVTISLSVMIVFLFVVGFISGNFFAWLSYAPRLHIEKKQNKKLNKEHSKLVEKVSGLQENLTAIQGDAVVEKTSISQKIKGLFKSKEDLQEIK